MEAWYKVATPREELRLGRSLDPSEFAVHLDQIESGHAPEDYRDPAKFFKRTFFSAALTDHCGIVLKRLSGETVGTAPVLSLLTQFGGGKTHTLATLLHLVKAGAKARDYEGVPELLSKIGLPVAPNARTAVFVGNSWDPKPGRENPWLEIAEQLVPGEGATLLGPEAKTSAPGTATLERIFDAVGQPILILFDETLNYIGRYPHQADQFHSFVQNLTSALTARQRCVALLSLPASTSEMSDKLYEWQTKLTKIVGRVGKPLIATDPEEISEIIRRRLFEDPGRKSMQQAAARQYARWVFERRDRLAGEYANFPEEEIRAKFEACYPFHPATLAVFQRKWSSLPNFQQTRGTLAMLGLWISRAMRDGFKRAMREPLITLGSAPLDDREFRGKVLEQLGETRLEAAITFDIGGENAHATALDKELSDSMGRTNLHQRVAAALFFESCGGMATDKAATLPDLRFALGDPETETTLIDTAVSTLDQRCYFLRKVGTGGYRFGFTPTLRKVHADRKASIVSDEAAIDKQVREVVEKTFRAKKEVEVRFPRNLSDVPNAPALHIMVMDPGGNGKLEARLHEWTINTGNSPRDYPGGLLWVVAESDTALRSAVADWLAWLSVKRDLDGGMLGELEESERKRATSELEEAKDKVEELVWTSYNRLLYWDGKEQKLEALGLGQMHASESSGGLTGTILARLRQAGKLNKEVGASYIQRNWPDNFKAVGAWPLGMLRAAFFQGHLTRLENAETGLRTLIVKAVGKGDFGFGTGASEHKIDRVWFGEQMDPAEIRFDYEAFLLTKEAAEALKSGNKTAPTPPPSPTAGEGGDLFGEGADSTPAVVAGLATADPPAESRPRITLCWTGEVPKDKWNLVAFKLLPKLGTEVVIRLTLETSTTDPSLRAQLNAALRDLGLEGSFVEPELQKETELPGK